MARRHRPRQVTAPAAVRAHLRRILPRAMPVPPSRSHRPAKGPGSYQRPAKHRDPRRFDDRDRAL